MPQPGVELEQQAKQRILCGVKRRDSLTLRQQFEEFHARLPRFACRSHARQSTSDFRPALDFRLALKGRAASFAIGFAKPPICTSPEPGAEATARPSRVSSSKSKVPWSNERSGAGAADATLSRSRTLSSVKWSPPVCVVQPMP